MRTLDLAFHDPALNLALDEVLLDSAERGVHGESLRFWESPSPFVVLGVSQRVRDEVHEDACQRDGVPVLRRCSAGGCVLQGPGSLNFNLVLSYDRDPDLRNIRASYCYILCRVREALATRGVQVALEGISDLALNGRKISGNAQKRRKNFVLHHGALLYQSNLDAMVRYLREPRDRPAYRGTRPHQAFVTFLPLGPEHLRAAVCEAFAAGATPEEPHPDELSAARALAAEKYRSRAWTHRR